MKNRSRSNQCFKNESSCQIFKKSRCGDRKYLSIEWKRFSAGMDDEKALELQCFHGGSFRPADRGCRCPFEFEPPAPSPANPHQVQFRVGVCRPEEGFFTRHSKSLDHLLQQETFPGCADLGMPLKIAPSG